MAATHEEFYPIKTFEACNYLADNAVQLCSDFYLLYDVVKIMGVKQFEFDLEMLTKQLDYAFQRYILYAVTREARHAMGDAFHPEEPDVFARIKNETHWVIAELHTNPNYRNDPIKVAQIIFSHVKNTKQAILDYLYDLEFLFGCEGWETNYGGESWRNITQLLIDRLTAPELNLITFVDKVWHTQHNNFYFLDKLIRARKGHHAYQDLENVLNAKFRGDYSILLKFTSYPLERYYCQNEAQKA